MKVRARFVAVTAIAIVCLVAPMSLALPAAAASSAASPDPATPDSARLSTPLFSARRVGGLVQSVAAQPELTAQLDGVVAKAPSSTCLQVDVDGRTLYRSDFDEPLTPASNQKVVTAQLALDVLGADYRYHTQVAGRLGPDGTVDGDLYLVGGGDPVLRTRAYAAYLGASAGKGTSLEALADAIVAKGVRRVTGSVIGDETRYDTERSVPGWPDRFLAQHQLGPLSALEVNQSFTSFPEIYSEDDLGSLEAASDPPVFAARTLEELLSERGVRIEGRPRSGARGADVPGLASVASPPLSEIVAQLLTRSDNQIAELLVKEAGKVHGTGGTTAAGLAVFHKAFVKLGLPASGVVMVDGSGLSYDNRSSCALLVALLGRAGASSSLASGLAVAGESGTLRKRFTGDDVKGRIRAKTGSLDDVSALSGFALPTATPPVVFSYIENGAPPTESQLELQEVLGGILTSYGSGLPLTSLGPR